MHFSGKQSYVLNEYVMKFEGNVQGLTDESSNKWINNSVKYHCSCMAARHSGTQRWK
jgi:Fe-S oxidoreductase